MVDNAIVSNFAAKVGQLVVNLASRRGLHVSLSIADSLINKQVLTLKVTMIDGNKSTNHIETLTEAGVEAVSDVAVLADAIHNKLVKKS